MYLAGKIANRQRTEQISTFNNEKRKKLGLNGVEEDSLSQSLKTLKQIIPKLYKVLQTL